MSCPSDERDPPQRPSAPHTAWREPSPPPATERSPSRGALRRLRRLAMAALQRRMRTEMAELSRRMRALRDDESPRRPRQTRRRR